MVRHNVAWYDFFKANAPADVCLHMATAEPGYGNTNTIRNDDGKSDNELEVATPLKQSAKTSTEEAELWKMVALEADESDKENNERSGEGKDWEDDTMMISLYRAELQEMLEFGGF